MRIQLIKENQIINHLVQLEFMRDFKLITKILQLWKQEKQIYMIIQNNNNRIYHLIRNQRFQFKYNNNNKYQQITQSIQYLHQNNLIHRDIKPENFIKVADQFKLIDFGLIRQNQGRIKTMGIGTPLFQAPEIVENSQNYTKAVDIWSLGCVFYEILTQVSLFQGKTHQELINMIKNCKIDKKYLLERLDQLPKTDLVNINVRTF
ncbi:unnamed protein product [Paramecium primaurelia]|uniref:Protein kinase domain-containing protein n=1 Tax=Paramecium primaurelia TaxID=5886 RepID=A0A8S1QNC8_PARPR|nr:unnamed protein product [Paramecium primaurelia]